MKKVIFGILIMLAAFKSYSQEKEFVDKLFKTISHKDFSNWDELYVPADVMLKVMHWPKSDTSRMLMDNMIDKIEKDFQEKTIEVREKIKLSSKEDTEFSFISYEIEDVLKMAILTIYFKYGKKLDKIRYVLMKLGDSYRLSDGLYYHEEIKSNNLTKTTIKGDSYQRCQLTKDSQKNLEKTIKKKFKNHSFLYVSAFKNDNNTIAKYMLLEEEKTSFIYINVKSKKILQNGLQ